MRSNIVKCVDNATKQQIAKEWASWAGSNKSLAKKWNISTRTLGRILKELVVFNEVVQQEDVVEYGFIFTGNQITLNTDKGEVTSIQKGDKNFKTVKRLLVDSKFSQESLDECWKIVHIPTFVETFSEGNLTVDHKQGKIFYGNFEVKHSLVDRIFKKIEDAGSVIPMVRFLSKLMDNPDKNIIEQLYPFLKHNCIEINNDGDIIAYRSVTLDYKDHRTGTFDNSVGKVVKMPRTQVNNNPNITCSSGLHCAAYGYASSFGGKDSRLVKVLVNPVNVVSVPTDYEGQKMRVCEFKVLEEV